METGKYAFLLRKSISSFDIRYDITSLIFFVTSQCDGRCICCLYQQKLNKKGIQDLTLDEIRKVSNSLGNIWQLQISGGEAFLRGDLAEICETFVKNNRTRLITIPTNGLFTDKIIRTTQRILAACDCKLGLTVSIDGTEQVNHKLRGIRGGFEKALKTFNRIKELSRDHKNLTVSISTRVTNLNIRNIPILKKELNDRDIKTRHNIFPIRGLLKEKSIRPPTSEEYLHLMGFINKNTGLTNKVNSYIVSKSLEGHSWPFRCVAGKRIGVIDSDGDVRLCELLEPIGNLRHNEYDFYNLWNSKKADKQRELIKRKKCFVGCTHGCFSGLSLLNSPLQILKLIFKSRRFLP